LFLFRATRGKDRTGSSSLESQAAGTAAHLSLARNGGSADIPVDNLQETLHNDGAYLGRDIV